MRTEAANYMALPGDMRLPDTTSNGPTAAPNIE